MGMSAREVDAIHGMWVAAEEAGSALAALIENWTAEPDMNPIAAWTCIEVEALADLMEVLNGTATAERLRELHADVDDEGDMHFVPPSD